MVWLDWHQKAKKLLNPTSLRGPFHILTITLLSLLLPLSFLLLSRFSNARHLLILESNPSLQFSSFLLSFLLYANPTVLYLLVSIVCVGTLVHGLTGNVSFLIGSPGPVLRSRDLNTAWIFVCTLQVCFGLGIEGSMVEGINGSIDPGMEKSLWMSKVIFFLGLHESMLHWSRVAVRPVVDDTVFGVDREETWVERVAMTASFATLWWWTLRDEIESLVAVAEFKRELLMGRGLADFIGWWLYYLTVTIGMVRVVKGFMWLGMLLLWRRLGRWSSFNSNGDEDKV